MPYVENKETFAKLMRMGHDLAIDWLAYTVFR